MRLDFSKLSRREIFKLSMMAGSATLIGARSALGEGTTCSAMPPMPYELNMPPIPYGLNMLVMPYGLNMPPMRYGLNMLLMPYGLLNMLAPARTVPCAMS